MTHRIAGALALALTLLVAGPASALTRLALFEWTPATGPVAGYAVYATTGESVEELVAAVPTPSAALEVESSDFISVRVAAYDSTGRIGPRSEASAPVRLCPGDFDGDEVLGVLDWSDAQSCFGKPATGFCSGADLDGNGIVSLIDLQSVNIGGEACPANCAGDFDGDGLIGITDVAQVTNCLAQSGTGACQAGDMDGNGIVSVYDINYLSSQIGAAACSL